MKKNALIVATGLAVMAVLPGCWNSGQHSKHTSEGIALAQKKINAIKSGVEWEAAERQFLAGDLDKALRTVDRSIAMTPSVVKCHVLKGRILMEKGNLEGAREAFLAGESIDPTNVDAQYYLGIVAERQSQFREALTRYNNAMQNDAANPQYLIAAAEMHIQLGEMDQGEELLKGRAGEFPNSAAVRHALGQLEMARSQFAAADNYLNEARLLAPDDVIILEDLTRCQIAARKYGDAEFNLNVLLKNPAMADRTDLKVLRVRCLAALDRLAEARNVMGAVLADPNNANDVASWIMYGNICARLEDPVRLRQAVTRIVALAPDRPEGYALRAMLMRMTNQPQAAYDAINKALSLNPNDPEQWVIRGLIQAEAGQFTDSQRSLTAALKLDPQNVNAQTMSQAVASLATVPTDTAAK